MDITVWLLIAGVAITLGGAGGVAWIFKSEAEKKPPREEIPSKEPEALPQIQIEAPLATPKARPRRFAQAFSSWLPLLKEKSKDRSKWEEALILSDMGPSLAANLLDGLEKTDQDPMTYFKSSLKALLKPAKSNEEKWKSQKPWVLFVVGVNGVGKTTTVVKLGRFFAELGKQVGVVGADTFRKAAIEQLERGCQKNGLDFFAYRVSEDSSEGADPAAVVFDGLKKFAEKDVILVDTSGRLHTKQNLMEELKKMKKVADKSMSGAPHDVWIVLDATLGQNALQQAKVFDEAVQLSGIILTKLDGLSRGGSVFELFRQLQVPIWFLGMGEQAEDLEAFDPENFVEELFDDRTSKSIG